MTTRRQRKYDDVHRRILVAASDGFTYRPMNLIGMYAIAEHADVERTAINRHFGDKKKLFGAVVERECKLAIAEIKLTVEDAQSCSGGETLKAFAIARFEHTARIFRYRRLNPKLFENMPQAQNAFDKFSLDEKQFLTEIIQSAVGAKASGKSDFTAFVEAILGALNGFQYSREHGEIYDGENEKIIGNLMDIITEGLFK